MITRFDACGRYYLYMTDKFVLICYKCFLSPHQILRFILSTEVWKQSMKRLKAADVFYFCRQIELDAPDADGIGIEFVIWNIRKTWNAHALKKMPSLLFHTSELIRSHNQHTLMHTKRAKTADKNIFKHMTDTVWSISRGSAARTTVCCSGEDWYG